MRIAEGDFAQANEGLKRAIGALGYQYSERAPAALHDDTGLLLPQAIIAERDGNLQQATQIRRRTLSSRLEVYREFSCRA